MISAHAGKLLACLLLGSVVGQTTALASTQTVYFDTLVASTTAPQLAGGDVLFVDAHIRGQTGALSHSVTFSVAAGVTSVSGRGSWAISTAAGPGPRLIGVNLDIFNASNALVVSDSFSGTVGGSADTVFASTPLAPGIYTLRATGTGVRESVYDLALEFGGSVPPMPAGETGSLPLQGASTNLKSAFFTTLADTRTIGPTLQSRDTLLIDTLVTTDAGALAHTVNFTPAAGIDRFTGDLVWMVSDAIGSSPRLIGVNVDVLDANGTLVASDTFTSTLSGFAHSTLSGTLGAGVHRIVVTGTAVRDASMGISLSVVDDDGLFANGFE